MLLAPPNPNLPPAVQDIVFFSIICYQGQTVCQYQKLIFISSLSHLPSDPILGNEDNITFVTNPIEASRKSVLMIARIQDQSQKKL